VLADDSWRSSGVPVSQVAESTILGLESWKIVLFGGAQGMERKEGGRQTGVELLKSVQTVTR